MGIKLHILCLFLGLTGVLLSAQESLYNKAKDTITADSIQKVIYNEQKNEYIQIHKNRITGRLFLMNTSNSLTIKNRQSKTKEFKLSPNKQDRIGVSVAFRALAISISVAPDFMKENKDNDDSKLFNLNLRTYFGKRWVQTLDLYQQKGFYLTNNVNNLYLPETKSFKIGGSTSFILNENFSFRAIVSQDEKQLKSAGSFVPRLVYYYTDYHFYFKSEAPPETIENNSKSFDIAFAPVYFYNFVPSKNLFISLGLSAGFGLNHTTDSQESLTSILTELDFGATLTYDFNNLYIGSNYNYLILNHNADRSTYVKDNIPFFEIFIGYRFKAPKKLVHKADKVNKKLHLK